MCVVFLKPELISAQMVEDQLGSIHFLKHVKKTVRPTLEGEPKEKVESCL